MHAQTAWFQGICAKLNAMSKENGMPLARRRNAPAKLTRDAWIEKYPIGALTA